MVFFPNKTIELWEYTEKDEVDVYGEPIIQYELIGTYPVDIQPKSPSETKKEYGEILTDVYKIYLDINTPITHTMLLRLTNEPDTYEILGSPMFNNHVLPHIKVEIQKQRKPTQLESGE